jgi:hypothetical protein
MPRHLLHGGQIHTQIEQVPDPGPTQVMGSGGLNLGLKPALATDPPSAPGAEPSQLLTVPQQPSGLEHRTEERARLSTANVQPVPEGWKCRRRQDELARLATL